MLLTFLKKPAVFILSHYHLYVQLDKSLRFVSESYYDLLQHRLLLIPSCISLSFVSLSLVYKTPVHRALNTYTETVYRAAVYVRVSERCVDHRLLFIVER